MALLRSRCLAKPLLLQQSRQLSTKSSSDELALPTDEHRQLRDLVAEFGRKEVDTQANDTDKTGKLNIALFRRLGDLGLLGITIPEKHGGAGLDATAACIVTHQLSKFDPGLCLAYLAHSMLFVNNFYHCSNEQQKAKYLPKVVSGEWIAGMGMTEPHSGTDVLGMQTTAEKKGEQYIINGQKTYITNGDVGHCFQVYAKVNGKVTAFVIDRTMEGFTSGSSIDKLGMRGSTMAPLHFENCTVPVDSRLGEEGQGNTHMMRNLELERITLAAMSVGIAERCLEIMVDYANTRKAFGHRITHFGQIQRYIAESYAMTEAAKTLVYSVAKKVGPKQKNRVETDAAKLFAAPVGKKVADYAIQVLGGAGYCKEYKVERLWRDAKLLEIGGGTLEAHHKNIVKDLTKSI